MPESSTPPIPESNGTSTCGTAVGRKRLLPRAATLACVSAVALGLMIPAAAQAATAQSDAAAASAGVELLDSINAPSATSADGAVWAPTATGFASTADEAHPAGTMGGAGGDTVVVDDRAELEAAAIAEEPLTIVVDGTITVGDHGAMVQVGADKTIVGAKGGGEIVDGGLYVKQTDNVIIRNLTFRDSYMPNDWEGHDPDNDNDGIRIDTSDHVWVDHNEFERIGDGQLDIRKDSTNVTASWNYFHDHNKTLGVGWTDNLETTLTLHHNRFSNVHQRNASLDNLKHANVYNQWIDGASSYGTTVRGGTDALVENSVFDNARSPLLLSEDGKLNSRGNSFGDTWGEAPATSNGTFEASDFYDYTADPTSDVVKLLSKYAGTTETKNESLRDVVTVSQDGTGDFMSVHAAVGAASRVDHAVEIVVEPGTYKENVSVWDAANELTIRSSTGNPEDVVITFDKPDFGDDTPAPMNVWADDVTLRDLTLENTYDGSKGDLPTYVLRDSGSGTQLDNVVQRGGVVVQEDPRG